MTASEILPAALRRNMMRYRYAALALTIFAVAFAVRLYALGAKPYWLDETATVIRASLSLPDMIQSSLNSNHSPLYFMVVAPLTRIGGGEATLRLPSALFGALACPVAGAIAARIGGRAAGAMTGLMMALSPALVAYGQEARSYALVTLLVAVSLYGLVRLSLDLPAAARPFGDPLAPRGAWITYGAVAAAALNVEGTALVWPLAGFVATLAMAWRRGAVGRGLIRNSIVVHGAVVLLALPCYGAIAAVAAAADRPLMMALSWIPPLNFADVVRDVVGLFFFQIDDPINNRLIMGAVPPLGIAVASLAALGAWQLSRRHAASLIALGFATLTLPVLLVALAPIDTYWTGRYLLWSTVPFFVVAGIGIGAVPMRWRAAAAVAFGILGLVNLTSYYSAETKPRWDLAADLLRRDGGDRDLLLFSDKSLGSYVLGFYLARDGANIPAKTTRLADARKHIAAGGRVWGVYGYAGQEARETPDDFRRRIAVLGRPGITLTAGDGIVLYRFDPK